MPQDTNNKVEKERRPIQASVNHREVLSHMIEGHVQGESGKYIAVREAINNSLDAGATSIRIRIGKHGNVPALFISDNGAGFSEKGVDSAMSYAQSANSRQDIKTIGANGTGLKSFLGLGNIDETKLILLSVHKDHIGCQKMNITFKYLLDLIEKKTQAEKHVQDIGLPKNWLEDIQRTTGTTLVLTGHESKRLGTARNLLKHLGEYLTPKACACVEIFDDGKWQKVPPLEFKGKYYNFAYTLEGLGLVLLDIYYGDSSVEGPTICGSINAIQPFFDLVKHLAIEKRKQVSKVWKVIGGHIYIERANIFRRHDGSFGNDFYDSPACNELLKLLEAIGKELEALNEQERNTQVLKKREALVEKIIRASQTVNPVSPSAGGTPSFVKGGGDPSTDPVCIVPNRVRLHPGQLKTIVLYNKGTKSIDFTGTQWSVEEPSLVEFVPLDGGAVSVKAIALGETNLIAKVASGIVHKVLVNISMLPVGPYISGPSSIKPGTDASFNLLRYEKQVDWQISPILSHVICTVHKKNSGELKISVSAEAPETSCKLTAYKKGTFDEIASKQIFITNESGRTAPVISINNQEYNLVVDMYCPDTVAQIDALWNEADERPTIVVNPLHPRVRLLGSHLVLDHYLAAIANAALAYQVEKGLITAVKVAPLAEEFIQTMGKLVTFK